MTSSIGTASRAAGGCRHARRDLYLYDDRRLSAPARVVIEQASASGDTIGMSAISLVEIIYLVERSRIPSEALQRLEHRLAAGGSVLVVLALDHETASAVARVDRNQVPDLPDRLIAATAVRFGVPLLTRDSRIQSSTVSTIC
jgi:predicted nucleic acid-binding protein